LHVELYADSKPIMLQIVMNVGSRVFNPGPIFSVPGFGIGEFLIPGSQDPGGIMGSRRMISKPVIIEYIWSIYGLIFPFFVTASQA